MDKRTIRFGGGGVWPMTYFFFLFILAMASYRGCDCVLLENEYTSGEVFLDYQRHKGSFKLQPLVEGTLPEDGLAFKECHFFMQIA